MTTSAGPRLHVSGPDAEGSGIEGKGTDALLGTEQLTPGYPAVAILQAEPFFDLSGTGAPDGSREQVDPEWRELGVELIGAGVPAVLIVPALPAELARVAAALIAGHVVTRRGADAVLLRKLRRGLAPEVEPAVLDDLTLFLNTGWYGGTPA